jgi:hypothetical protein
MRISRRGDARVSCATVEGRQFWQALTSLQSALSKLNSLYEFDTPHGTTEFVFPAEAPVTFVWHRLECIEYGTALKLILGASEPVLPAAILWTTGTCEFIRLLECDLSRLLVQFQRRYHSTCYYFEGILNSTESYDCKHQLNCDLGDLRRLLVRFLSFIRAVS